MAQVIVERLRSDIASGRLANGRRLPLEHELIAQYGVSRAVVREALRLLESIGLIEVRRGAKGGAVVTHRTSGVVRDAMLLSFQLADVTLGQTYEALTAMAPPAARMAAERRPLETYEALSNHTAAQAELFDDPVAFGTQGHLFNSVMIANCGNDAIHLLTSSLLDIMRSTAEPLAAMISHQMSRADIRKGYEIMLGHQRRVADVIRAGDGAAAETAWRAFMERVGYRYFQLVPRELRLTRDIAPA
jgi:DNA-binding FadR family transcriptional regulator